MATNRLQPQSQVLNSPVSLPTTIPMSVLPPAPTLELPLIVPSSNNQLSSPQTTLTLLHQKWQDFCDASNGIGTTALILAVVFGIGAWVGMNMQYNQGSKSLELSIWSTCADHEVRISQLSSAPSLLSKRRREEERADGNKQQIQNSSLCRDVMAKGFDQFHPRSTSLSTDVLQKRSLAPSSSSSSEISPLEALVSDMDPMDREIILQSETHYPRDYSRGETNNPEIRATLFPLIHILYTPIRLLFSLIEALLLTTVLLIHKVFGWIAVAVWFLFQTVLYSGFEGVIKYVLRGLDEVIVASLPGWVPSILVSGTATAVCVAGLKSYWYGLAFLEVVKWSELNSVFLF